MKYESGEEFLNALYQDMHMNPEVMFTADKSDTPVEKIGKYLDRVERVHDKAQESSHKMERLKHLYYEKYVIKELPDSFLRLKKKIAIDKVVENFEITSSMMKQWLSEVQENQKSTLDRWIDFLSSNQTYPTWFKVYAFRGMLKLGKFDKSTGEFGRRSKNTTDGFADLNPEALELVYQTLTAEIGSDKVLTNENLEALEHGESFKRLYEHFLGEVVLREDEFNPKEGVWKRYERGSSTGFLIDDIEGAITGWCIAGSGYSTMYLKDSDIYVYFVKGINGGFTDPRIAIRMEGTGKVAEIRGVGYGQELEESLYPVLSDKLKEFPGAVKERKRVVNVQRVSNVYDKFKNGEELSDDDLRLIYGLDGEVASYGLFGDKSWEILQTRDKKKDLSRILGCQEDEVALSDADFEGHDILYYYGNIYCYERELPQKFQHLKGIIGNANFYKLSNAKGLESLEFITKGANFYHLISAIGLDSLEFIGDNATFSSLSSAKGLESLEFIGGDGHFQLLSDALSLKSLHLIGGHANFSSLASTEGLEKLCCIGGDANFSSLVHSKGLEGLQSIGGDGKFPSLIEALNLNSLQFIGGDANFSSLVHSKGLEGLQSIGGDGKFPSLIETLNLNSLQFIGGDAIFSSLISAIGLESLQRIGFDAFFDSLTSAEGIKNIKYVGGYAHLPKLSDGDSLKGWKREGVLYFPDFPDDLVDSNDKKVRSEIQSASELLDTIELTSSKKNDASYSL